MPCKVEQYEDLLSTRFEQPSGDISYIVLFGVTDDGDVTIVSGVMDKAECKPLHTNAVSYTDCRAYSS